MSPTMNKNLVSGSLLCRDGFKVVLESNKVVVSKFGQLLVQDAYNVEDLRGFRS